MIREKCRRDSHKFRDTSMMALPYVFCARWRCDASAVAAWAPANLAAQLHNAIPAENRFPPEEMPTRSAPTTAAGDDGEGVGA